ncbi:MAG TPA: hypothetical protein VGN42_16425 [Pirellulales bacterium]|nr:hypothetical protein [Pirellulales bacterium]
MISNPAIVAFSPYLDNGSNSTAGTGFQGDLFHLDVTNKGALLGGGRIAAAIAAAPSASPCRPPSPAGRRCSTSRRLKTC